MERSVEKADASDNRRKSKPLDSLTVSVRESATSHARLRGKGGISADASKSKVPKRKRNSSIENGAHSVESGKKRSGKEVSLNSFINDSGKKVRLGVSGLKANGSFSGVGKREKPSSSSAAPRTLKNAKHNPHTVGSDFDLSLPREENQFSPVGNLRSSNGLEVGIVISKRPRGVLRRKKRVQSFNSENETVEASSRIKSNIDQLKNKLSFSQSHINKKKRTLTDFMEDGSTNNIYHSGARNGGNVNFVKATKRRSQGRKLHSNSPANKDSLCNSPAVFPDDDEDNLEQNAARMLSSRFNPSCAGFSHRRIGSLKPSKESSFVLSRGNSNGFDAKLSDTGRVLRPRNYGGRGFVRKRRHFYEVCSNNMDPYWVVKQRIRVLWPLDKCWYFGLVKDYDPLTKMHHVKYDDRDEEWINLQNERFKLLLFPSELSNKFNHERSKSEEKKKSMKGHKGPMNELSTGGLVETEPIISWLTRSTRRERPSALGIIKTRRRILSASKGLPSTMSKLSSLDGSVESKNTDNIVCLENRKLPFVYSRRRIHKDRVYLGNIIESNSDNTRSAGPISLLASVADTEWAMEEFYITVIPKVLIQVTVSLRLPIWDRCKIMHGFDKLLLCSSLFIFNYQLIQLLPLVRMEVSFMDNWGLNLFLFEGCLSWAVYFLCLTFRENYDQKNSYRSSTENMQLKKIRINMSNLNNDAHRLHFVVNSFLEGNSRWRYLESWLKQHCIRLKELCPEDHVKSLSISCGRALVQPLKKIAPIEGCQKNRDKSNYFPIEESDQVSDITLENFGSSSTVATDNKLSSFSHLGVETDALSLSDEDCLKSSHDCLSIEVTDVSRSLGCNDPGKIKVNGGARSVKYTNLGKNSSDEILVRHRAFPKDMRTCIGSEHLSSLFPDVPSSPDKSEGGCFSSSKTANIKALRRTCAEDRAIYRGTRDINSETSLLWEMNEHAIHSPNVTAPRSVWQHNRHSLVSPVTGSRSSLWSEDFIQSGFVSATKKPRTQISYPALSRGHDIKLKNRVHHRKGSLRRKLRTDLPRKATLHPETHRSFQELLTCQANVLITTGDRGWRELGAEVVLDSDDQRDWKIVVKVSGVTKFTYKADHVLQAGNSNRYTHAIIWKGGKDWSLEFSDRNQWLLFKMMHGQCFNQNIRAASVKNIPIPGVRLIDDHSESFIEVPFVRTSSKYYQLAGTEVDIALDPSHVLYDMDSDDDKWVSNFKESLDSNGSAACEVTDDMFERVMDMFERVAYVNQCDLLTDDEISEYMTDFGPFDIIKAIHEFWHEKRRKNGMPLIRQYQPPLWERYHQQLKEWEQSMFKLHSQVNECQEKTIASENPLEKPPMFAFCLKPRGLEANKGSKQRSHKKLMYNSHHSSFSREQDGGLHASGRRWNVSSVGDEKALIATPSYEGSHSTLWKRRWNVSSVSDEQALIATPSYEGSHSTPWKRWNVSSVGDEKALIATPSYEGSHSTPWLPPSSNFSPKFFRNFLKKNGMHHSPWDPSVLQLSSSEKLKRNGVYRWNSDTSEWKTSKQSDINEFRLRDASSAAQHASNMAKLKREKAQWLMHKADLALHKAVVAIMTADAIKTSQKDLIGDE